MSASAVPQAGDPSGTTKAKANRARRGTLQSGFSLLSRGEPKIWLTGGMLIICLAMIVGLLTLIIVNGVATFWPGPLDWLILTNNQMDIGEPQAVQYGKPNSSEVAPAVSDTVMPDGSRTPEKGEEPSRFYRTANFDITGRHYRWFEPQELTSAGIVRPEWALVIERLSWGRMLALPSRLSLPAGHTAQSQPLAGMLLTDALTKELSSELEGLATSPATTSSQTDAPPPETSDAAPPSEAEAGAPLSPLAQLTASLANEIQRTRSQQMREAIAQRFEANDGRVIVQTSEGAPWSPLDDLAQLKSLESIAAARIVWDDPAKILERIAPVIADLADQRQEIKQLMHQISRLDRRLSEARVAVRQAELDTGRSILAQVDSVGPLVEALVNLERLEKRLTDSAARASQDFSNAPDEASLWQRMVTAYRRQTLEPNLQAAKAALATWREQFAQEPIEIRKAADAFEATWREVLEQKLPLETQIQTLQAAGEGFELAVLVPGEPQPIELSPEDWDALQKSQWTDSARAALSAHGLVPLDDSTHVTQLNPQVTQVTFVDAAQGHQSLWCVERRGQASGSQASGSQASGSQASGSQASGSQSAGSQAAGSQAAGSQAAGSQASGSQASGSQASGSQASGSQASGSQASGSQASGSQAAEDHVSGERAAGGQSPDDSAATSSVEAPSAAGDEAAVVPAGGGVCLLTPQRTINCNEIVRIYPANRLSVMGKLGVYGSRWGEFLLDDPREANTEGGVFPAIWGTVVMTLIMTLAVVPFGVIAALYLREYTRSGPIVSLVRISINNLAGVPSIVYGVFGLAFFCYTVGAYIDGGPKNAEIGTLPGGTWYLVLGLTVLAGVVAFFFSLLSSSNQHSPRPMARLLTRVTPLLWFLSLVGVCVLMFKNPFFDGFYEARLPTPTFGKEGLIWASLTLALLTLPVVIVATEEALAAVPNSLREGSLACGASKWQTIRRIVLPHARPGILTGAILAMARGIGEVAPLMLVGALPVAPDLPLDTEFPYFHGSRSFMHLGYQIYWLGFQSQNSEASKPLVFTCTLLLLLIVVALNLSAILLRARLRRRFQGNQF